MPIMSGYEVCEQLRHLFPRTLLPVILVSAKNDEASICKGFDSGGTDYVTKPFNRQELMARITTQVTMM